MSNDHVASPFREILDNILKPKSFQLPVELPVKAQPNTRFHPDDIEDALRVLLMYWPANQDARNADERIREAFSRCMVSMDRFMSRREEQELEAQYRYELGRRAGGIMPRLHDSDSEPVR